MSDVSSINHVSFTVSNLDESVGFYVKVLGLKLLDISERDKEYSEKVTGISGARLKIAYLSVGEAKLELIQYLSAAGDQLDTSTNNIGSAHVCFNVSNIDDFYKNFTNNGGKTVKFPAKIPAGSNKGKKGFYGEDPEGNKLEFISEEQY